MDNIIAPTVQHQTESFTDATCNGLREAHSIVPRPVAPGGMQREHDDEATLDVAAAHLHAPEEVHRSPHRCLLHTVPDKRCPGDARNLRPPAQVCRGDLRLRARRCGEVALARQRKCHSDVFLDVLDEETVVRWQELHSACKLACTWTV